MKTELTEKAKAFAAKAHANQTRKYTGEPYIVHPIEVSNLVASVGGTEAMVAAALLHDVVEDCGVSPDEIRALFGDDVAELVYWLTDVSKPEDGNRALRKTMDRDHISAAPPEAKTIKLADLISNSATITVHDRDFAKVYMREKRALLRVLTDGNADLFARATAIIDGYYDGIRQGIG